MRAAIAEAVVGDEQKREDPTVTALQNRVAALLGQEAAVFLPTATMANQIALKLHGRPGDVLIAEETLARPRLRVRRRGSARRARDSWPSRSAAAGSRPQQLRAAAAPSTKAADQRASVLSLEDTHNNAGGRVWPLDELDDVLERPASSGSPCTSTAPAS